MELKTLNDWWDYVQTNNPLEKAKYFLRNYGGMGYSLSNILDFLKTKVALTCHRRYAEQFSDIAGCYSIADDNHPIIFRVDPTTPTASGSRPYPSVVIYW